MVGDASQSLIVLQVEVGGQQGSKLAPPETIEGAKGKGCHDIAGSALEKEKGILGVGRDVRIDLEGLDLRPPFFWHQTLEKRSAPVEPHVPIAVASVGAGGRFLEYSAWYAGLFESVCV